MNDIVKRDAADTVYVSVPRPDKKVEDALLLLTSGSFRERGALQVLRLPDEDTRGMLLARMNYLSGTLRADRDKIGLLVTQMLRGYRARSTGDNSGMRLAEDVKLFQRELMMEPAVPTWAVALVCGSIRFGQMEGVKPGVEPTTALLRRLCDQKAWSTKAEINVIREVLHAKKWLPALTEDQRIEVRDKFVQLHDELVARNSEPEPAAPLSINNLIDMAGGVKNWDKIPDAARMKNAKTLGREADRLTRDFNRQVDEMADVEASRQKKRSQTKR